jgi:cell division topological specificity factor
MSLFDYFFSRKPPTASVAKERLQILLAHERAGRTGPDFMPTLQKELIAVVRKYVEVRDDMIKISLAGEGKSTSVLEINVEFESASKVRSAAA